MRREALEWAQKITLVFIAVIVMAVIYLSIRTLGVLPYNSTAAVGMTPSPALPSPISPTATDLTEEIRPTATPVPISQTATPVPQEPESVRIGIVAGHYGNDSGAVCPDGLREVDINLAVSERVIARLRRKEYTVELLEEFDTRIEGYQADVFMAIHADSCIPGLSGFKIARSETSAIPDVEDRLVECVIATYGEKTGLDFHANSISEHMRDYHAFRDIAYDTPGIIVELGFMSDDRNILLYRQDRLAKGLVDGIQCFLDSQKQP